MSHKNPVTPPGIDPGTVRLVAQRFNPYATPGPTYTKLAWDKISTKLRLTNFNLYKTMCPEVDSASENEYQGFLLV
jgi:hypothetical protein